jgi:hypothetical protein
LTELVIFLGLAAFLLYLLRRAGQEADVWRDRYLTLEREGRERERAIRADATAREAKLLDRFLVSKGVQPVEAEHPAVVKFKDADDQTFSAADLLWREDEIKEMLEAREPNAGMMYADEAKALYPELWADCERVWEERHAPLLK